MITTKCRTLGLAACVCLMFGGVASAQDEPADRYLYVTYSVCDLSQQERADEIFAEVQQGVYEGAITDGTINTYGFLKHHTGGKWRRAVYFGAASVQGLLDAQDKLGDQMDAKNKKLGDEFSKICNSHDDYIWRAVAGNTGMVARGGASFSTYYVCDQGREDEADALVTQVFAPVYDKMVAEGKLKSWGWQEHIVGGSYRRLATMSATDVKSLLEARASIVEAMTDNKVGETFTEICNDHTDYIWDIASQSP